MRIVGRPFGEPVDRSDGSVMRTDRRHLVAAVELARRSVFFEYIALAALEADARAGRGVLLYADWPTDYVEAYFQGSWHEADPVLTLSRGMIGPLMPGDVEAAAQGEPRSLALIELGRRHGISVPMAVPVYHLQRQVGVVSFSRHKSFTADEVFYLAMLAPVLHREFAQDLRLVIGPDQQLSRREVECLRYASTGMTSEEIATVLPLAAATVTAHLRNAAGKLGASNRVQAIAEAIRRGIID